MQSFDTNEKEKYMYLLRVRDRHYLFNSNQGRTRNLKRGGSGVSVKVNYYKIVYFHIQGDP